MPSGVGSRPAVAAVRAAAQVLSPQSRPGWPSAPGAVTRARSGRPAGGRRSQRCPDAGQAGRSPVRVPSPVVGTSVQPVERTSGVQASGVQASAASRCPDGQAFGVRGATAALSAPRWTWSGSVRRAALGLGAVGRRAAVVRGRRGRLPASGRTARDGPALAVAGSHAGRPRPGPPLGRRPGCGVAWPPGRHGRCPGRGAGRVAGEPGMEQVLTGPRRASWAGHRRGDRPRAWTRRW
jgi:hypothetical protein